MKIRTQTELVQVIVATQEWVKVAANAHDEVERQHAKKQALKLLRAMERAAFSGLFSKGLWAV